ncbi:hypothetical protein [Thermoproteus tenax]|uniref:Uncharacterized protein n=1 Tax=Thermoproteus tenax (strain ATCC 35583 / DSM 2078 / JCM 9277 / NBRC 100435 / Kra 1) TaxID=768679 RepID=G4RM63_THETK|nr:hypothetical protein [Thermoproteus tenax]CCC82658.1 hypothetical protein TTX_2045 [Thermoproteus tenax Kra 1]
MSKRGRPRRNRRIFVVALIAIIFAEIGWILGTSGFRLPIGGGGTQRLAISPLLSNAQLWVLTPNGYAPGGQPPVYNNAIVYVAMEGVSLPQSLLNTTEPVYILMLDPLFGPYAFSAANYVYAQLFGGNYTLASRYQNKVILIMPGEQQQQGQAVFNWVVAAMGQGGVTLAPTNNLNRLIDELYSHMPVVAVVENGTVVSVTVG